MTKETTGDEEDDAGASTEGRVQEPEPRGRHFLEKAADPTDEIICGKEGQTIPVSVGLPTIKIREITVGGTEK